jgi:hypothetical protein
MICVNCKDFQALAISFIILYIFLIKVRGMSNGKDT